MQRRAHRSSPAFPSRETAMFRSLLAVLVFCVSSLSAFGAEAPAPVQAPAAASETITLGGGCFWCLEAVFSELKGVDSVVSGFAGGHVANPTYEQVSAGSTGHAEVVQITFDPKVISRDTILRAYFTIHDPTTVNRQGADVGAQYRSIAFYRGPEQKAAIEKAIQQTADSHEWDGKIVTEVVPFTAFYKAEDYHQQYYKLHGENPYCSLVIAPKVAKFRKLFRDYLKA
jgi:peptide-methionine (S)-S-oxide reductase